MSNSGDLFVLNDSSKTLTNEFIFERKEVITSIDANSGAYPNGAIDFDLASLSSSGAVVDFKNSKLVIPYVVVVSGANITNDAANCWALSMKNSIHCVDSISVQFGNNQVVEIVDHLNIPQNFKLLSELSEQELNLYGPSIGFQKDSAFGLTVETGNSKNGPTGQERNNDPSFKADAMATGIGFVHGSINANGYNSAILKRQMDTSYDLTGNTTLNDAANLNGKNYCLREVITSGGNRIVYYGVVTLELKYLNDFFDKLPLVRNTYIKLKINTNLQSKTTIDYDATGNYTTFTNSLSAKTCPYMIAPLSEGLFVTAAAGSITIESGIGSVGNISHSFRNCRLVCPTYVPTVDIESRYFSNPVKTILYNTYHKTSTSLEHGFTFNSFLVSASISRIRSILIVPMSYNGTQPNIMLSPFTSCPTTCAPYAFVESFNVRIGGSPLYSQNQYYSYEMFQEEILARGVNGNKSPYMASGLINQTEWDRSYRFIYVDLSRKAGQGQDNVSKQITLDGRNASGKKLNFLIYVEYQKEVRVNIETGKLVLD